MRRCSLFQLALIAFILGAATTVLSAWVPAMITSPIDEPWDFIAWHENGKWWRVVEHRSFARRCYEPPSESFDRPEEQVRYSTSGCVPGSMTVTEYRVESRPEWIRRRLRAADPEERHCYFAFGWPRPALGYACGLGPDDEITPEEGALELTNSNRIGTRGVMPMIMLTRGFTTNTAVFAAGWLLLLTAPRQLRSLRRRNMGACPACGYDLLRHFASGCPECGWNRAATTATSAPQ